MIGIRSCRSSRVAPQAILAIAMFACACSRESATPPSVDGTHGAVAGVLRGVSPGTAILLCRTLVTSCTLGSAPGGRVGSRGKFTVSAVPPGHYVIAYASPDGANQVKAGPSMADTLVFTFGSNIQIQAEMRDRKWRLTKEASSDTHITAEGAELNVAIGGAGIVNASVQHKASGLWMEYRDGLRYESVDVGANRVSQIEMRRWGSR